MNNLILVRHGQSLWNKERRFTGWADIDLTEQGKLEAKLAGKLIKELNIEFDVCFTSVQKRAINTLKLNVDLVPKNFTAEGLIATFKKTKVKKSRIFIPRAAMARDTLVKELRSMGNTVKEIKIYDTVLPSKDNKKEIQNRIYRQKVDYITFTSSSTVDNFFKYVSPARIKNQKNISYVCIGPITAKTLRKYQIKPTLICNKYTIDNLIKEIVKFNKK